MERANLHQTRLSLLRKSNDLSSMPGTGYDHPDPHMGERSFVVRSGEPSKTRAEMRGFSIFQRAW